MNVEVLKLRKEILPGGRVGQILDIADFKRLISKYKLTLDSFLEMGLSRSTWDNTLAFYGLDVNQVQGFRLEPWEEKGKTHLRSYAGFSTKIPIKDLKMSTKAEIKIQNLVNYVESYFPGAEVAYSKYHSEPLIPGQFLAQAKREIMDLNEAIKYINRRVTKWAKKKGLEGTVLIHSKLEHNFAKILDELGLKYQPQFQLGPVFYDFILMDFDILIEVDGGKHNKTKDNFKNKKAKDEGLTLLRFDVKDTTQLKQKYENIKGTIYRATHSV